MNTDLIKNNLKYVTAALAAVCIAMVILTVAKASAHVYSLGKIETAVENAKENSESDDETVKKYLEKGKETAGALREKSMFVSPKAKPKPPVCYGIIGSSALINGKQYKVGDKIGTAEVLAVGTKDVTIMWDEKEMKLTPFQQGYRPSSGGGKPSPKSGTDKGKGSPPKPATATVVSGGPPHGMRPGMGPGRGGFMNMSPEQRQAMIERYKSMSPEEQERFREERRREMMQGGGGYRGGGPRDGHGR